MIEKTNKSIANIPQDKLRLILKHGKRSNILNDIECKPLIQFSFQIVKFDVPELLKNQKYVELAKLLFDGKIGILNANKLLNFVLWVLDEIENINKIESNNLQSNPDTDLVVAGINNLDVFGYLNVVDTLAGGDILKWENILKLPYNNVLDKMIKNNIENKIQKNYQKIISKKK